MKITKNTLKQLIKEELAELDKSIMEGEGDYGAYVPPGYEGEAGKRGAGKPQQWVEMADSLRQMSRVWVDVEDAKMLGVVADILYAADDQYTAAMNKAMGRKHTPRVRN